MKMVRTIKVIFHGVSNNNLKLTTCEDKIVIPEILQSYVLHWYHKNLLHTGMDITEATICHHLYFPITRNAVRKESTNCDTCQRTKRPNKEYGKLPAKEDEEIPYNKICVDLIGTYALCRKRKK